MKIILCKGQLLGPISGADEILVSYAVQLQRSGQSVCVLLLYPYSPQDQYYLRLREAGVEIQTVASSSVRSSLGAGRKIARGLLRALPASQYLVRKNAQKIAMSIASRYYEQCRDLLKTFSADIVHVITPDPGAMVIISAAHDAGIPVLYQELGMPYHPPNFESHYEQFTTVLPLCSEVAALSPLLAEQCRERLPFLNNLSVLPIITDELRNGHRRPGERDADITVGFAARIEHLKGPLVLLEAFAEASKTCRNLKLMIAGAGSLEEKVTARARELGVASRCESVGVYTRPEQRNSFMQRLDMFALPSLTEGTPNSIIEAMAHAVPIIATAVGGIPDVVTDEAGILVPADDPAALAKAIIRLAEDAKLREQMGGAARKRYETLFSPEAVMPLLLDTYRRVAAREPPNPQAHSKNGMHPWAHHALRITKI
ncbi:MAG TPA: glycosyltransferase family 4 protein [Pyrinomonadaceae bacterium]|jgi:glycosyltransferase involved in cell wall biosynthesis|nr:glycosyltransferase family 4 protein [Pyrinomonadaceae bacterium]